MNELYQYKTISKDQLKPYDNNSRTHPEEQAVLESTGQTYKELTDAE